MSGILAIVNTDGAPVDRELVQRLTTCMADRGPDGQSTWVSGAVGMGHSAFHTTAEAAIEQQPLSFDGQVWLNAYARIDDRAELRRKLAAAGREVPSGASDADFILHAYHTWGRDCLDHLLGDFAFIIWDGREQRLFCARDHFGIRPFFYARAGDTLIVGNTLSCLRRHPAVPQDLDDLAIADFLLLGAYKEPDLTAYAAIRRLPPGHSLTWNGYALRVEPYWSLPVEEPLLYANKDDYVDQFGELFNAAVVDRLRASRIAISMSGGLDSTAVAAVAADHLDLQADEYALWAFTNGYTRLIPDEEGTYARMTADYLGIPLSFRELDDYKLFERWESLDLRSSEPVEQSLAAWDYDENLSIAKRSRVVLTGFGGDPLLYPEAGYFYALIGRGQLRRLLFSLNQCRQSGIFPPLYLRTWMRGRRPKKPSLPLVPSWFNRDLMDELNLVQHWQEEEANDNAEHPGRPTAVSNLDPNFWGALFESYDAGNRFLPTEYRHPFLDTRLVRFALRIPPAPWYVNKFLLRSAHGRPAAGAGAAAPQGAAGRRS